MPKIKPSEIICMERGRDDAKFYYEEFKNILIEDIKTNDLNAKQDLSRLNKWIAAYELYSFEYHKKNFILWRDCFEIEEDGISIVGTSYPRPRAPFIPVFDERIKY